MVPSQPPIRRYMHQPGKRRASGKPPGRLLRPMLNVILWCLILLTYFFQFTYVEGTSMAHTLENGDRLFVDKLSTQLGQVERGEIVIFTSKRHPNESLIKRLVALEGDTVEIRRGRLLVNGELVEEAYLQPVQMGSFPFMRVPLGQAFVLGDNRINSEDSRVWGTVPLDTIKGIARFRYWPPSRIGPLEGQDIDAH